MAYNKGYMSFACCDNCRQSPTLCAKRVNRFLQSREIKFIGITFIQKLKTNKYSLQRNLPIKQHKKRKNTYVTDKRIFKLQEGMFEVQTLINFFQEKYGKRRKVLHISWALTLTRASNLLFLS